MSSRIVLAGLGLGLAVWSCTPPCESIASAPQTVCHRADAGLVAADSPFVLQGQSFIRGGTCSVKVDGGQINLSIDGMACAGNSDRAAAPGHLRRARGSRWWPAGLPLIYAASAG